MPLRSGAVRGEPVRGHRKVRSKQNGVERCRKYFQKGVRPSEIPHGQIVVEKIRERREKSCRSEDERKSAGRAAEKFGKFGAHAPILRGFFRQSRTSAVREKSRTCGKRDERGRHGGRNGATRRPIRRFLRHRYRFRNFRHGRFFKNGGGIERAEDVRIRDSADCGCRDGLAHRARLGEKRFRLGFGQHRELHRNRRGSFR